MAEEIIVVIGTDGGVTIEGEGFSGPACDTVLRALAEALGEVEEVVKKPEYHEAARQAHRRATKS